MKNDIESARIKIKYVISELATISDAIKHDQRKEAMDYTKYHIDGLIKILSIVNDKLGDM